MRKGQNEAIGLVVIVILIVVIGLFGIRFYAASNKQDERNEFYSTKANNLVNAVLKASVCDRDMEEAITACCENMDFCEQDACTFVEKEVGKMLKSLGEETKFEVKSCFSVGSCNYGISSSTFLVNNGYEASVIICKK